MSEETRPLRIEPGYRRESGIMTERDWSLLETFTGKFDYWLSRHAGIEAGAPAGTRTQASPSCRDGEKRAYAYHEALVSKDRLREAVGELMRVMEKLGRGVPG